MILGAKAPWLQVLEASPIAQVEPCTGKPIPIGQFDLQVNRREIQELFQEYGQGIASVAFDIATPGRFGKILAMKAPCDALHIYCHGSAHCLVAENESGLATAINLDCLTTWLSNSPRKFKLVFISACCSRNIAQAFLDAGVPSVICSELSDLSPVIALAFSKAFYRALLMGNVVDQAYELARSESLATFSANGYETPFILLGESAAQQKHLFCARPAVGPLASLLRSPSQSLESSFPTQPDYFLRSDLTVYNIVCALKTKRLVLVSGPEGVGKSTIVKDCCRYLEMRLQKSVRFQEMIWASFDDKRTPSPSSRHGTDWYFQQALTTLRNGQQMEKNQLLEMKTYFQKRQTLLMIDAKSAANETVNALVNFLEELLSATHYITVTVILSSRENPDMYFGSTIATASVQVPPMNFESTVEMFASCCDRIPAAQSRKWVDTATRSDPPRHFLSLRQKRLYELLGSGFPGRIRAIANISSEEDFNKLINLGHFREFDSIESRVDLLQLECFIKDKMWTADFERDTVKELRQMRLALEALKPGLPTISLLKQKLGVNRSQLYSAALDEEDSVVDWLQKGNSLRKNIMNEEAKIIEWVFTYIGCETIRLEGKGPDVKMTRYFLDQLTDRLSDERASCTKSGRFNKVKYIDTMLGELDELRLLRPSFEELAAKSKDLSDEFSCAKNGCNSTLMLVIGKLLSETKDQLQRELSAANCGKCQAAGSDDCSLTAATATTVATTAPMTVATGMESSALVQPRSEARVHQSSFNLYSVYLEMLGSFGVSTQGEGVISNEH